MKKLSLILFGVLVLALVEGGLRLFWEPPNQEGFQDAIRPFRVRDGIAVTAPRFRGALRFQEIAVPKPEGRTRIVCIGGSTTFGYPYGADEAWPARLERWLTEIYPNHRFEVVNLGGNSYGSERALGLVNGLDPLEPDWVLVALGDTEFVEDSYRVSSEGRSQQLFAPVRSLYLAKLLATLLPEGKRRVTVAGEGAAGAMFSPVLDGTIYRPGEDRREQVARRFATNLARIVDKVTEMGAQPVLLTLPSNLADWPPDPDERQPPEDIARSWHQLVRQGDDLLKSGHRKEALAAWMRAASLWDGNAVFCYRLGRLLLDEGWADKAVVYLKRARDFDPAPIRALSVLSEKIQSLARTKGIPLVDLDRGFAAQSAHGIIDSSFLLDHAHPNRKGHSLIASLVARAFMDIFPQAWHPDRQAFSHLVAERFSIVEAPPQMDPNLAFVWGQVYLRKGLEDKAMEAFQQAHDGGYRPYATVPLAQLLARSGRVEQAWKLAVAAARDFPDFTEVLPVLAWLDWMTGRLQRAETDYRRALEAGWRDERTYGGLTEVLVQRGKGQEALLVLREGLEKHGNSCLLLDLAARLAQTEKGQVLKREGNGDLLRRRERLCGDR